LLGSSDQRKRGKCNTDKSFHKKEEL
jgi:hypothetical protein